jgi:flagellin-like protein
MTATSPSPDGRRAAANVIGVVLLVAMVFSGALLVVGLGSDVMRDVQDQNDAESTRAVMQEVDAKFASLSAANEAPRVGLDFGRSDPQDVSVTESGYLNVTLNGDGACSTNMTLTSVRYKRSGSVVAYQAGGVFRKATGVNSSTLVTAPDVRYRQGALDVTVVNVSGNVDDSSARALINQTGSEKATREHSSELLSSGCDRIDSVNLTIRSEFHEAWRTHLVRETGATVLSNAQTDEPQTIRLVLEQSDLPRRTNYETNTVINVSNASYMDDVTVDGNTIGIDKGAANNYTVSVEPVRRVPPDIGRVEKLDAGNITNTSRAPIDVVFVVDESGSMAGTKIAEAEDAAQTAVGVMNTSAIGDRAAVVGYTAYAGYFLTNGEYFSNDSDAVNNSIEQLSASGSTDLSAGLNASNSLLGFRTVDRQAHVFLLTDGQNSPGESKCDVYGYENNFACADFFDDRTIRAAEIAARDGYTIHTFAYGAGADEDLLKDVKNETNGTYHQAADGNELKAVFKGTVQNITAAQDYVVRTPLSTNFTTADGRVHAPQIAGDTDGIATNETGGTTFLNVNDPTAPSLFSHSFAVSEGENVTLQASTYECTEWHATGLTEKRNGTTYPVARCGNVTATNETLDEENVTVNRTGDDASWLLTNAKMNDSLDSYVDNANETFVLESNQFLVTFDFPDSENAKNRLVLLYEVGISERDARFDDVVSVRTYEIRIES